MGETNWLAEPWLLFNRDLNLAELGVSSFVTLGVPYSLFIELSGMQSLECLLSCLVIICVFSSKMLKNGNEGLYDGTKGRF